MFDGIFEAIEEWMRDLLTGVINSNMLTMFTEVNEKTNEIGTQVGMTPQSWNGSIFSMIQSISNTVILPIAGMIITFVLCYELISMLTEKNSMHDGICCKGSLYTFLNDSQLICGGLSGCENVYEIKFRRKRKNNREKN